MLYIVITLLLGFGAVNTGNNLLYLMVSALLGFMAVSGLLGHSNLQKLRITLAPPEEIYAGVETLMGVQAYNGRRLMPACLLDFEFSTHTSHLSMLKSGLEHKVGVPVMFAERGIHTHLHLKVSSSFPVNFFVRHRILHLNHSIYVFPHPVPCHGDETRYPEHATGMTETHFRGTEGDISRIGNYHGSEPLKMIHWKLTARHDTIKIKELSALQQPPVEIDPLDLPGSNLEQQLGCAAYLINHLLRRGQPVGLKLTHATIPPDVGRGHKLLLLTELARYAQD
ncbi:MAG: DUF58 domain-containing protein [Geobacteraceae bacterium]|nr:DUF58 domain-containing protein [Geobacteraceae bacterium]